MAVETDQELFERYHMGGQLDALSMLVERHRQSLYGYLMGMVCDPVEADEQFQAVWTQVIRKADGFKGGNFRGWVLRIAHNLVIDKSRRRRPEVSLDASGDTGQSLVERLEGMPARGVWVGGAARELGASIAAAVAELPEEQRDIFLLRMVEDMTFREIAEMRKISINTALARMQYALTKLRRALHGEYKEWRQG
jgi:RNA polymerase sigma-70 factor (ECF subfamily)